MSAHSQRHHQPTRTFDGGTTQESFEITLDPTITNDTEVTVALHTEDGNRSQHHDGELPRTR